MLFTDERVPSSVSWGGHIHILRGVNKEEGAGEGHGKRSAI